MKDRFVQIGFTIIDDKTCILKYRDKEGNIITELTNYVCKSDKNKES